MKPATVLPWKLCREQDAQQASSRAVALAEEIKVCMRSAVLDRMSIALRFCMQSLERKIVAHEATIAEFQGKLASLTATSSGVRTPVVLSVLLFCLNYFPICSSPRNSCHNNRH